VLLSLFALIGVALAAGGLYGLISFLVLQRTREVGVRMAMGATSGQIVPVDPNALRWTLARIAGAGRKPGALWRSGAVDDRRQRRGCLGAFAPRPEDRSYDRSSPRINFNLGL
jgi:hypothetical protein